VIEVTEESHIMTLIAVAGHFDGEQIRLDEPLDLKPQTRLLVTILPDDNDEEREDWLRLSAEGLEVAYGDDEPEYTLDMLKEINPDYEGR